jgi:hypothetical protein
MAKRRSSLPTPPGNDVLAFKGQNRDLPSFVEGLFIHCRADRGSLILYVDIPLMVSQKSIKKAAPIIQAWSERLRRLQKQGPWRSVGEHRFYEHLAQRNSSGAGYGTLATELNAAVAKELEGWFHDDKMEKQGARNWQSITPGEKLEKLVQLSKEGHYSFRTGLSHAQMILRIMGIPANPTAKSDDTVSTWCEEALQNLQKGLPAFTKGRAPITTARVARYFRSCGDRIKNS